jgi:hypothetical protein
MADGLRSKASSDVRQKLPAGLPIGLPIEQQSAAELKNGLAAFAANPLIFLLFNGRDGGIRTHDPLHPMQVRYQAALRPD